MDLGFIFLFVVTQILRCQASVPGQGTSDFYLHNSQRVCPDPYICDMLHRKSCTDLTKARCGDCIEGYRENEREHCTEVEDVGLKRADIDTLNQIDRLVDTNLQAQHVTNQNTGSKIYTEKVVQETTGKVEAHPTAAAEQKQHPSNKKPLPLERAGVGDVYFLAIVAACSVAGLIGLVFAGVCWYKLQKNVKEARETEYPAYGVTGPNKETVVSPGDRKMAQSAQMWHYQHQKQQMIALEKANCEMKHDGSEEESDIENEEGDYTVYECPGLAPTGEMEVRNPLFSEDVPPNKDNGQQ